MQPPSLRDEFARRQKIIEALEVTKNDERLSCLLRADTNLHSYSRVLLRVASYLKDPVLAEKLVDFPTLDKHSPDYKNAVANVFTGIAMNGGGVGSVTETILLKAFANDQAVKDDALRFILVSAATVSMVEPDIGMTRRLIQSGADVKSATAAARAQLLKQQEAPLRYDPRKLDAFLGRLSAAEAPRAPAP